MDRDRIAGIAIGLVIIAAIFLLPFGSFPPTSNQPSGATLFSMVTRFLEDIAGGVQQPTSLLIYEVIILLSFVILVAAGVLGFYPLRSGVIGILGIILITTVTIFNPVLGFNIPSYGAGYFIVWGASIAAMMIGRLRPNARRKVSSPVSQPPPEEVVETSGPPMDLFKPLSGVEGDSQAPSDTGEGFSKAPVPMPPVGLNVIEEEMARVRAFLVVLEDEKKDVLISEEAYDRLSAKLRKMLDELEAERKTILSKLTGENLSKPG
jgi:hypothetical protein